MCCSHIFNMLHNFKQHLYIRHKLVLCYTVSQEHMYDICIPWYSPSKNPTTCLCVFCSTPWHISSPDTMSNLKVYNGIPMLVIMSPDIVMFQLCQHGETVTCCHSQLSSGKLGIPWQAILVLPHIITLSHYTFWVDNSARQDMGHHCRQLFTK